MFVTIATLYVVYVLGTISIKTISHEPASSVLLSKNKQSEMNRVVKIQKVIAIYQFDMLKYYQRFQLDDLPKLAIKTFETLTVQVTYRIQ